MRQVARSPKRSSHEDSDVQRDVNIRVHEGAIDSVAMRMIMFKKESGMGIWFAMCRQRLFLGRPDLESLIVLHPSELQLIRVSVCC